MTNPWREFQGLLPQSPLLIVEVIAHHGDDTSTVELPGGQQFRARGVAVATGAFAFVRDGEIRGEAPGAAAVTLEV